MFEHFSFVKEPVGRISLDTDKHIHNCKYQGRALVVQGEQNTCNSG